MLQVVDLPAITQVEEPRAGGKIQFNAETARIFAARSAAIRRSRMGQSAKPTAQAPLIPAPAKETAEDKFPLKLLNRVRKQIMSITETLEQETDPQKIDRLCNALSSLSEVERKLAMRPTPAPLKQPVQSKRSRTSSGAVPLD